MIASKPSLQAAKPLSVVVGLSRAVTVRRLQTQPKSKVIRSGDEPTPTTDNGCVLAATMSVVVCRPVMNPSVAVQAIDLGWISFVFRPCQ